VNPNGGLPAGAPQAAIPPVPQPPEWVAKQTLEEQKWIDDVLRYWEARSDKIKLFECKFRRWDWDAGFVDSAGKRHPRTYAEGTIKYGQPDKGLFKIEKLISILPGEAGKPPQEVVQNPELGEHWICDGDKIYSFEANKKQVTVTPLPPEMRGKAIVDGPLPFMFGAKAETIKARYWIRPLPPEKPKQYWLEAVPKSRADAQNFKMVRIVLSEEEYLPELLIIYLPNYDPPRNDARQTYLFLDRKADDDHGIRAAIAKGLDPLGLFNRAFFNPAIPAGWKKVEQNPGVAAAPPPALQGQPAPPPGPPAAAQRQLAPVTR
jgi:TIGR03009 family protein